MRKEAIQSGYYPFHITQVCLDELCYLLWFARWWESDFELLLKGIVIEGIF